MKFASALLAAALFASASVAQPLADGYVPPAAPTPPNPTGLLVRLIVLTAGTLLLCGGVLWLAKRANRIRTANADGGGRMKHQGSLTLDRQLAADPISDVK